MLPVPEVDLTVSSTRGSGDDSCLGVRFTDTSDTLSCVAGVVDNLFTDPTMTLTRDGGDLLATQSNGLILTHHLASPEQGLFTCTVCITVTEAGIVDHCSNDTLTISSDGEYVYMCIVKY